MLQIIRFLSENICDCVLNNLSMNKINYMLQQKKKQQQIKQYIHCRSEIFNCIYSVSNFS